MNSNWWNFTTTPDLPVYSGSQPFPTNISSYFRRPAKIIKPTTSRNQSPRNPNRRRMTTQFPARTRSVAESQRTNRASQWSVKPQIQTRPTSWHPSPMTGFDPNDFDQSQFFTQISDYTTVFPFGTANVNGLVTPMSYPVHDEPQIQELITPLEELSAQEAGSHYLNQQQANPYWNNLPEKVSNNVFDPIMRSSGMTQMWWPNQQFHIPDVATAPTSPNFLPMPDMGDPFAVAEPVQQPPKDELVGMGLYDSPADVQSASLLFGQSHGSIGRKSLKLEESFEPVPNENDDEEEDEDDAEEDSEQDDQQSQINSDTDENHLTQQQTVLEGMGQYPVDNIDGGRFDSHFSNGGYMPSQWPADGYSGYSWI